jgi:hypothetical protein
MINNQWYIEYKYSYAVHSLLLCTLLLLTIMIIKIIIKISNRNTKNNRDKILQCIAGQENMTELTL